MQEAGANQVAAEAKYHGEWVAITGTILDFATGLSGGPALELGATAAPSLAIVWCEFPKDAVSQVASLSKGRRAELICLGDIFTMAPHFRECRLVGSLPPEKVCEPGAKHKIKETMSQAPGRAFLASDRSFAEAMLGFIKEQDVMSAGKLALSDAYFTVPAESEVTVLSSAPQGLCEVRTGIPWRKGWVTEFQLRF